MTGMVKTKAGFTNDQLDKIPGRDALIDEYKQLDQIKHCEISLYIKHEAGRYFYKKTLAGENIGQSTQVNPTPFLRDMMHG
jgi:hypothetical protein